MISDIVVDKLRNDTFVAERIATYAGSPAVFSDVIPEDCRFPAITVRTMQISVQPHIKVFNVYVDYWDHNPKASRLAGKIVANHIENKLDGYTDAGNDMYSTVRFRLQSGYAATRDEYNGIHYNLFFGVRACRKQWAETETY